MNPRPIAFAPLAAPKPRHPAHDPTEPEGPESIPPEIDDPDPAEFPVPSDNPGEPGPLEP